MGARTVVIGVAIGVTILVVVAVTLAAVRPEDRSRPTNAPAASPTVASSPAADEPVELLPNLLSLDATELGIESVGDQRRLRFAGTLANSGPGPLVLQPGGRGQCEPGEHAAHQVLYVDTSDDGRFQRGQDGQQRRAFAGCMLRHPTHDHWHFDAMASYRLRLPGTDEVLAQRPKVSFCLRDNDRFEGVAGPPREHFGECSATDVQGISPGWVDVYGPELDGQWLALPRTFTTGVVCLDLAADPRELVRETDESDNASSTAVRVSGDRAGVVSTTRCE